MTGPVHIGADLLREVLAHCVEPAAETEKCGLLAGPPGGAPARRVPMRNALAHEPGRYAFDGAEQLAVWAELDQRGEDPHIVYHSHPYGPAYPSPGDVALATDPDVAHLIVAVRANQVADVAAFRIVEGRVDPVAVFID